MFNKDDLYLKKIDNIIEEQNKESDIIVEKVLLQINKEGLPYQYKVNWFNKNTKLASEKLKKLGYTVAYHFSERIISMFINYDIVFYTSYDGYGP